MKPRVPTEDPLGAASPGDAPDQGLNAAPPPAPKAGGLRLLLVEDNPADVELIINLLRRSGRDLSVFVADTQETFEAELTRRTPDLILSDYRLPTFNGLTALDIAQRTAPDIPFIFVTGAMGEEIAIETLKLGATDYILKSGLSRLVPAVGRALREAQQSREHEQAAVALERSHALLRAMTARLLSLREQEQTREAHAVRKELGQALAGVLDQLGLAAAIEWQADDFQTKTGIKCHVSVSGSDARLNGALRTACFRIFQEALTNILRHARATAIEVALERSEEQLQLRVEDNGRGIAAEAIANQRSKGLAGMRERAARLGGDVVLSAHAPHGTTVTLRLPLPAATEDGPAPAV